MGRIPTGPWHVLYFPDGPQQIPARDEAPFSSDGRYMDQIMRDLEAMRVRRIRVISHAKRQPWDRAGLGRWGESLGIIDYSV